MKNKLILLFVVLATFILSCGKSSEPEGALALYGEWALQTKTANGVSVLEECEEYNYLIFYDTHMGVYSFRKIVGTQDCEERNEETKFRSFEVSGNQLIIDEKRFTYTKNGDILTITDENGVVFTYKKDARKTPPPISNLFIGTWALESYVVNGVDKTTDCGRKETVVFTDKEITVNSYYVRQSDGACVPEVTKFTYTFSNGKVSNITTQDGTVIKDSESSFTIVNGKLILTLIDIDENLKIVITYKKQ